MKQSSGTARAAMIVALAVVSVSLSASGAASETSRFTDVSASNVFAGNIGALAAAGITRGCNPPDNSRFCPDDPVTRGQMAAFLDRALHLDDAAETFGDVSASNVFAGNIGALAAAGITRGCNPPDNSRFCPDDPVTRGQMAAFLDRALHLDDAAETFGDVSASNVFAGNIGALAAAGITRGCNPPDNSRFCPDDPVTRGQMAAFLDRSGLTNQLPPRTEQVQLTAGEAVPLNFGKADRATSLVVRSGAGHPTVDMEIDGATATVIAHPPAVGSYKFSIEGQYCSGDTCQRQRITVVADVSSMAVTPSGDSNARVAIPSVSRVRAATNANEQFPVLLDQVTVVFEVGTSSDVVTNAASEVGGVVVGGIPALDLWQIGIVPADNLSQVLRRVQDMPAVVSVAPTSLTPGLEQHQSIANVDDYGDDSAAHWWHHELTRAYELWEHNGFVAAVSIIEPGEPDPFHEDLSVFGQVGWSGAGPDRFIADHATHVGGLSCGARNGVGLVGAAGGCWLEAFNTSVAVTQDGNGQTDWLATLDAMVEAVYNAGYADSSRDEGQIAVANMSLGMTGTTRCFGGDGRPSEYYDAVRQNVGWSFRRAVRANPHTLYVVSAGNGCHQAVNDPIKSALAYEETVLLVASINASGNLSSFSSAGVGIDIAAPGGTYDNRTDGGNRNEGVFSTLPGDRYGTMFGTSMAAPQVAGIAAAIRGADSLDWSGIPEQERGYATARQLHICLRQSQTASGARSGYPTHTDGGTPIRPPSTAPQGAGIPVVDAVAAAQCIIDRNR